jgi:hypothetical protein
VQVDMMGGMAGSLVGRWGGGLCSLFVVVMIENCFEDGVVRVSVSFSCNSFLLML